MNDLSKRIREAREAKGWSQRDLAKLIDVSQQTVAHWEQGGQPRGKRLEKLAELLGVTLMAMPERDPDMTGEFHSYLVKTFENKRNPTRPQTDANAPFIDYERLMRERSRQPVGLLSKEAIQQVMERIRDMGRLRSAQRDFGGPGQSRPSPAEMVELRSLRDQAFEGSLALFGAKGKLDVIIQSNPQRRFDYVSDTVIAELLQVPLNDPATLTPMKASQVVVRLATAKAMNPDKQVVLVLVIETGDIEQFRMVADRLLNFDCQALRVTLRLVTSYLEAAEVITNLELAAPMLAKMEAREKEFEDFLGKGPWAKLSDIYPDAPDEWPDPPPDP